MVGLPDPSRVTSTNNNRPRSLESKGGVFFYGLGRPRCTSTSSRPRLRTRAIRPCRAA
jgi:hypothetical protein